MVNNRVITCKVEEVYKGQYKTLGDVLSPENEVPENYFIDNSQLSRWEYLKGSKREERVNKYTGQTYFYSEGSMAFPILQEQFLQERGEQALLALNTSLK